MSYSIRLLTGDDADAYRAIRLEALTNHPESFGSTAEDFVLRSLADNQALLEKLVFFGAFDVEEQLVGIMAHDRGEKREAHRAWLIQVYVKPVMRGTGCAKALLKAIVEHARAEVLQLHLSVATHNEPALRLYQKAGFAIYGTDPRWQYVNGRYVDEHLMVRFFDEAPGKNENV